MNHIDARIISNKYINNYLAIHLDNIPFDVFLFEMTQNEDYLGLMPAWLSLDNEREEKYMWEILDQDNIEGLVVPILLCPDDMDFSCIIVVAKVFYTPNEVIWEKIGVVSRDNWNITEWRKSGIRNLSNWTDDDWEKNSQNLDISNIWDKSWEIWISENWSFEEYMRVHNYTHPYFNNDENIKWFSNIPKLCFSKKEYQECIEKFREYL